jgi:hypothetical protein
MTFIDKNASAIPHEPVMDVEVLARNEKGQPTLVRHVCRVCGRLISDGRHA